MTMPTLQRITQFLMFLHLKPYTLTHISRSWRLYPASYIRQLPIIHYAHTLHYSLPKHTKSSSILLVLLHRLTEINPEVIHTPNFICLTTTIYSATQPLLVSYSIYTNYKLTPLSHPFYTLRPTSPRLKSLSKEVLYLLLFYTSA